MCTLQARKCDAHPGAETFEKLRQSLVHASLLQLTQADLWQAAIVPGACLLVATDKGRRLIHVTLIISLKYQMSPRALADDDDW